MKVTVLSSTRSTYCCEASARLAEGHFEGVLPAVDAVVPQAPVGREADAGKVLIGLGAGVDALGPARIEVDDEELHDGIGIAGFGILERKGLVVKLAVETHHLHHGHVALVETQVGDAAAVGRKGVGPCDAELLLVDPVGGAVDDGIPLAVGRETPRTTRCYVVKVEVVMV